jgi:hypothetical protein
MADDRRKNPPRQQMTLGGQVLYDSRVPISDAERGRRIKLALHKLGWKLQGGDPRVLVASGVAQSPKPPARMVSGELLPAR